MPIEVEIRSFISEDGYYRLKSFFNKEAKFLSNNNQETYYLESDLDLRLQKNDDYAKLWLKNGDMHDKNREEKEIIFDKKYFDDMYQLFCLLKYKPKIKWLRNRIEYDWDGIKVCLDNTKGYGYIIELEQLTNNEDYCDIIYENLKNKLESLNINISPRDDFDERYRDYEKNWKKYLETQ